MLHFLYLKITLEFAKSSKDLELPFQGILMKASIKPSLLNSCMLKNAASVNLRDGNTWFKGSVIDFFIFIVLTVPV